MVEPLKALKLTAENELLKRYQVARKLLKRCIAADRKPHWKEGESLDSVIHDIREWLQYEKLGEEIGEYAIVPAHARGDDGTRLVPDLTRTVHVCEYQARIGQCSDDRRNA